MEQARPATQAPAAAEAGAAKTAGAAPIGTQPAVSQITPAVEETAIMDTQLPGGVRASPLARKMAAERGVDLGMVKGSGPGGRITRDDVKNFQVPAMPAKPEAVAPAMAAQAPAPALTFAPRTPTEVPISRLRTAIARRMTEAKQQVPHFYVSHEYKMDALMALRKQANALLPENEKISVNDFLIKAVSLTLREFPNLKGTPRH